MILLGQSCEKVISSSLQHSVGNALSSDLLKELIKKSIISGESGSIEITVNESEVKALTAYCAELAAESGADISLSSHSEILSGFTLGFKDKNVYLDYAGDAIADALGAFLRPELAKLVSDAVREFCSRCLSGRSLCFTRLFPASLTSNSTKLPPDRENVS